jgi:hypothetical protein
MMAIQKMIASDMCRLEVMVAGRFPEVRKNIAAEDKITDRSALRAKSQDRCWERSCSPITRPKNQLC